MGVSEILDGAIKLLRANLATMAVLVTAFTIPFSFLVAFLQRNFYGGNSIVQTFRDPTAASSQTSPGAVIGVALLTYVSMWIVLPLVCQGTSRVVMASYFGGELKAGEAFRAVAKGAPAALVATVVVHLAELVSTLGFVVGIAFVMPLFVMVAPVISLEHLGPFAAVARSVRLARRRYWPTVGVALLAGLLAYLIDRILGFVPGLAAVFIGFHWGWLIIAVSAVVQSFVTVSIITIVATLVYLDNRIRQEGLDIEVMAAYGRPR